MVFFMKKLEKFGLTIMAAMLLLAMVGVPVSASANSQTVPGLTEDEQEIATIVLGHFENYTDSEGNVQIKIINENELMHKLENSDVELDFEQLQSAVIKFNNYMAKGNNIVSETADDIATQLKANPSEGVITTLAVTCSDVLTAIGLIHSGSYSVAAALLGVTGPVPLVVSAAYSIGSMVC